MKILIIRFSSLGDIILTTPVISALRKKYPQAEINYVTKAQFAAIISANEDVNFCYELSTQTIKELALEMNKSFDLVVDLHRSLRSKLLLRELKFKKRVKVRKPYFKRWFLVYFKVNLFKEIVPISVQYLKTLKPLGISAKPLRPVIYANKPGKHKLVGFSEDKPTIAIAPGAKWFTKRWPADHFISLLEKISAKYKNYQIVLLGGADEKPISLEIENYFKGRKIRLVDFIGKLTILETAYILSESQFLVSNDSALVHIASAYPVFTVALFLSTVEEFGFGPYYETSVTMGQKLPCRPCDHKGRRRCPKGHFQCAYALTPEKVFYSLEEAIGKRS